MAADIGPHETEHSHVTKPECNESARLRVPPLRKKINQKASRADGTRGKAWTSEVRKQNRARAQVSTRRLPELRAPEESEAIFDAKSPYRPSLATHEVSESEGRGGKVCSISAVFRQQRSVHRRRMHQKRTAAVGHASPAPICNDLSHHDSSLPVGERDANIVLDRASACGIHSKLR